MSTFGQTSTADGSTPNDANRYWASKFVLSEAGDVTKVTAAFDFDSGASSLAGDNCKAVIYADNAGSPGALKGVSSAVAVPAGDQTLDFPLTVSLAAGTYWLGIVSDNFNSRLNVFAATGGNSVRKEALSYASPADPMGTPDATANTIYTVYATYTPVTTTTKVAEDDLSLSDGSVAGKQVPRVYDANLLVLDDKQFDVANQRPVCLIGKVYRSLNG